MTSLQFMDRIQAAQRILENPLAYPGFVARRRARVLLRVWRYPSFEPYSSWAAIETEEGLFVRRIVWDQRGKDILQPTTYGCEARMEKRAYDALLEELCAISLVPFSSAARLGVDGTLYGIEHAGVMGASIRMTWWQSPPSGWEPLQQWHRHAMEAFDLLLPAPTAGGV